MLSIQNCKEHILHELRAVTLDPALSVVQLVNDTGHALANARGWYWMQRKANLNIVGSQEYVALSGLTSFRNVIRAQVTTGWLEPTDFARIQDLRMGGTGASSFPTIYAVVPDTTAAGVVSYRMELWGTPSGSVTNGLAVYYQGGFQALAATAVETAQVAVPDWFEGLFVTYLRAIAKGRVENDLATLEVRIEGIRNSALYRDAVVRDAITQQNFGQVRNGAVAMQLSSFPTRRMPSSVP